MSLRWHFKVTLALAYLCLNIIILLNVNIYAIVSHHTQTKNVIIQQPLITTICVNRFHQSRTGRLSKNTAYVLCNRCTILTAIDGQLIVLILHIGSSINSGHYISIGKVGDIWFDCDDVKITKIELNNFCNSNTVYMLFYKRNTWWKHLKAIGLVKWIEEKSSILHGQQVPPEDLFLLLTLFHIFGSLAFVSYCC